MQITQEKKLWNDKPSQIINLNLFLLSFVLSLLLILVPPTKILHLPYYFNYVFVLPILYSIYLFLDTYNTTCELTSQRLRISSGILNREINEMELYRVIDYRIEQPLFLRIFGLSNIYIDTSDNSDPFVFINAVSNSQNLIDTIRNSVEKIKIERGVREVNINN